jgi:molecular chaperone DnaK
VGSFAENFIVAYPERAVAEIKRYMGQDFKVSIAGEEFTPQEISAILLRHLKVEAERALGRDLTQAVITVPAYFTNAQRQATRDAGEMAGFEVRRLVNEPTAAALAYGLERPGVEERILVYDLGGGTFDVTVLELSEGVLDVLSTTGNSELGGKDFDERIMRHLHSECLKQTGVDLTARPELHQLLRSIAKKAKEELSGSLATTVSMPRIGVRTDGTPVDFSIALSRAVFDAQVEDLIVSTAVQLDTALSEKRLKPSDINTIVLVGGSTRIPAVRKFVSSYFGGRPLRTEIDPDEAVALGAAILGGMESGDLPSTQMVITDVCPHTLGVAIIVEDSEGTREAGRFDPLIRRQSTIPRTVRKAYSTVYDNQASVRVQVYQGDAEFVAENEAVGEFTVDGLPTSPAGMPVEVEFSYNLSGELEVVARIPRAGIERRVLMHPTPRCLSDAAKAQGMERLERLWAPDKGLSSGKSVDQIPTINPSTQGWQTSRHYSRVAALLTHAEKKLPLLPETEAERVASLIRMLRRSLVMDDENALNSAERSLTDVLFDLG